MKELNPPVTEPNRKPDRTLEFIEARSRPQILVLSFLLLAAIALVDYFSGYELLFFLFYYVPVALLAWRVSLRWALFMAVACALVWFRIDTWLRPRPSPVPFELWNGVIWLAALFILAIALSHIRRLNNRLRESLARLQASTAEAEKLRGNMQTVCAWTNRIKDEGKWISFEEFMEKHYGLQFTHGISEDAARNFNRPEEQPHAK